MLKANLYVDRIDIAPYLTPEECRGLGGPDCAQVAARLKDGSLTPEDCRDLEPGRAPRPVPGGAGLGSPAGGAVSGAAPAGAAGSVRDQRARARRARCWSPATANSPWRWSPGSWP